MTGAFSFSLSLSLSHLVCLQRQRLTDHAAPALLKRLAHHLLQPTDAPKRCRYQSRKDSTLLEQRKLRNQSEVQAAGSTVEWAVSKGHVFSSRRGQQQITGPGNSRPHQDSSAISTVDSKAVPTEPSGAGSMKGCNLQNRMVVRVHKGTSDALGEDETPQATHPPANLPPPASQRHRCREPRASRLISTTAPTSRRTPRHTCLAVCVGPSGLRRRRSGVE